MTGWKRWLRLTLLLAATLVLYFTLPVSTDVRGAEWVRIVVSLLAFALLTVLVLHQVQLQIQDPERRIDGLVVALLVGVTGFAYAFYVIELHHPAQFAGLRTRIDALYFTMTTLLTVGYGDIHAVGQPARALVLVQMVFNVVVIATAATTLSNQVRMRALARAEERQARRTQRKPR
jgi:voltage-gated potassium channel